MLEQKTTFIGKKHAKQKNKRQTRGQVIEVVEEAVLEPELKLEYVKKALRNRRQPAIKVSSLENLRKRYE